MKTWIGIALSVFLSGVMCAQVSPSTQALRVFDKSYRPAPGGDTSYHGGPVFEQPPDVYIIWYGNWTSKDKGIIDYFFEHLGGTTAEKINTTYSDNNNKFVPIQVNHTTKMDYNDHYSLGKSCNDTCIQTVVANAISNKHLPNDINGIYFVLTYKDVVDPDGFCDSFCGYHGPSQSIVSNEIIKYSMVGDPGQCPSACSSPVVLGDHGKGGSPNMDPDADGTAANLWHEFSESLSDPEVNLNTAWDGACGESGDCCAWQFGKVNTDKNGNLYTNTIGSKNYLMQMMLELTSKRRKGDVPAECENVWVKP